MSAARMWQTQRSRGEAVALEDERDDRDPRFVVAGLLFCLLWWVGLLALAWELGR